ncbi:cytochrome P450 [Mangrovicoccus sp. HB161399]|uniref:cytochrome P450 n=1 Tax=Mangrovicoccus sp. HB161399 TaxID=2720392 RepID=UPI00352DD206
MSVLPPKPPGRGGRIGALRFLALLRKDILSAQSPRLYRAKMAEFRTPFFRSYVVNDPGLVRTVLQDRPDDFPKSPHLAGVLGPLLGNGLFLSEGADWARQARTVAPLLEIEPRRALPHVHWAGQAALARLETLENRAAPVALEAFCRRLTADVMFRLLVSRPVEEDEAAQLLAVFDAYQASAPLVSLAAVFPRLRRRAPALKPATREAARELRKMVARLVARHRGARAKGKAQGDLVGRLLEARDPETGLQMEKVELVDQVTTLLLAGHETSAAALAWMLYLLALHPAEQAAVAEEAERALSGGSADHAVLSQLERTRAVAREALRLYPPLPMLLRETAKPELFRGRDIPAGAQIVISPWHLHRHEGHWPDPDGFRPGRWSDPAQAEARKAAFLPFSAGPRACPGAGLAMAELVLLAAMICRDWALRPAGPRPRPFARLTLRAEPPLSVTFSPRRRSDGS